jgi:hypothetical protein
MKRQLLLSIVSVSIMVLGGCAGTGGTKSSSAEAKVTKAGPVKVDPVKDIVDAYKKAVYGKDGVRKHTAVTMKGTISIEQFGIDGPFTIYSMAPDSNVSNIEIMGMTLSSGCHKGTCWNQQPGAGTATLTGNAAAMQLQQADFHMWDHLDRHFTSVEVVTPAAGTESPNHKIKAVKKSGDTDYYEFSKETGLLVAAALEGETAQGHMKIAAQFKNYKDFDGEKMPTELIQVTPQATVKLTISEVSFAPVTEDKFAKPN